MAKSIKYSEAALERARQRAITPEPKPQATVTKSPDLERIRHSSGVMVPREYYNLDKADQDRLLELIQQQEQKKADDSVAINAVNQLLDLRESDSKRIRKLESMVGSFLPILESMQRQIDGINTSIEVGKSDELTQQQVELAQQTTNLQAVGAREQSEHERRVREAELQAVDHQQRITAAEEPVARLEGRVKATMTLAEEKGNAVIDKAADVEGRLGRMDVRLQEAEGQLEAAGNPVSRAEIRSMVTESVTQEMSAQLEPLMERLIERKYVLMAPTTGSDGFKQDSNANTVPVPFLTKQPQDGAMEKEVKRALKRKGKS